MRSKCATTFLFIITKYCHSQFANHNHEKVLSLWKGSLSQKPIKSIVQTKGNHKSSGSSQPLMTLKYESAIIAYTFSQNYCLLGCTNNPIWWFDFA